jgi:hypothetical protein
MFWWQGNGDVQFPATNIRRDAYLSDATRSPPPSSLYILTKMPPIRTPLGSISGNRLKGLEISPYIRRQVKGQANYSITQANIVRNLKLITSTI